MNWLLQLPTTNPVAHAVAALSLVCCAGMMLGSLKVRGVGLGTAGVLFAGIIAGHFGKPVDHHTLAFVKEFGLILFVFTIGLQLGPGFFAAFRRQGMRLNLMAAAIVLAGTALALVLGRLLKLDFAAVLGVLAGATTNTPSLGGGPTDPRDDPRHRGRPPGVARARLRRDVSRRDSRHHRLAARGETLLPD